MKLKFKNTEFNIGITKTDSNFGIKEKDKWCLIKININNDDLSYEDEKEMLTLSEINHTIYEIKKYLNNEIKSSNLTYIKKFIKIKLLNEKEKSIELEVFEPVNISKKSHKLIFDKEEILEFVKLLEESE